MHYHKMTPWTVSEEEWDTRKIKVTLLYALRCAKGHLSGWSSENIKPIAFELHLKALVSR